MRDLALAMAREGMTVHVVTPMRPGAEKRESINGIHIHRFFFFGWHKGIQLGQLHGLPILTLGSLITLGTIRAVCLAWGKKTDLFHAYWVVPGGFMAAVAGLLTRKPVIATAAGSDLNIAAARKPIATVAFLTFKRLSALIAVSRPLLEKAASLGMSRKKITHIPGPVGIDMGTYSTPACTLPRGERPFRIVYAGNLTSPKRVDTLICAAGRLKSKGVDFELTIAGTGSQEAGLKQLARKNGIEDRVLFIGSVDHDQIPGLLQSCHVFWHCSEHEGLPVSIMEAMAAGLPVIAAAAGGIPELVKQNQTGFCLGHEDDAGFAITTLMLYNHDPVRMAMGCRARHQVERQFDQKQIIRRNLTLYKQVLDRYSHE